MDRRHHPLGNSPSPTKSLSSQFLGILQFLPILLRLFIIPIPYAISRKSNVIHINTFSLTIYAFFK